MEILQDSLARLPSRLCGVLGDCAECGARASGPEFKVACGDFEASALDEALRSDTAEYD